jgi:hypothetical protein
VRRQLTELELSFVNAMREEELQECVLELAGRAGFMAYHTHDSRRSHRGFPDLVLVHRARALLLFVELKSERGKTRPEQKEWLEHLGELAQRTQSVFDDRGSQIPVRYATGPERKATKIEVHLWRPRHWFDGTIEYALVSHRRDESGPVEAGPLGTSTADDEEREEARNGER